MPLAERIPFDENLTARSAYVPSTSIDNIIRLALNNVAECRPSKLARAEPDFGMAVGLLDRATATMAALSTQRDGLEHTVDRLKDALARQEAVFADKLAEMQAEMAEWERRAKITKAQLQDSENRLTDRQMQIETLTTRVDHAEAHLAICEQDLGEARRQSQMYHDRIIATFSGIA